MAIESNLSDSLEELSRNSSPSLSVAKVKRKPAGRKGNKESAASLLDSILDDSSKAAEEEMRKQEEARKKAEEEAALRKEEEDMRKRFEGEQEIIREQRAQEELRKNQSQMAQKVQREKDIEAGLIDVEAEERAAREAEAKRIAEAEEKARRAKEKAERKERIAKQKAELAELQRQDEAEAAKPKPSKAPKYIAIATFIVIVLGVAGYIQWSIIANKVDPYQLKANYISKEMNFKEENLNMIDMNRNLVAQAAPKPTTKPSTGKKKAAAASTAAAPAAPKPTLTSKGKGGLLGKRGGL